MSVFSYVPKRLGFLQRPSFLSLDGDQLIGLFTGPLLPDGKKKLSLLCPVCNARNDWIVHDCGKRMKLASMCDADTHECVPRST